MSTQEGTQDIPQWDPDELLALLKEREKGPFIPFEEVKRRMDIKLAEMVRPRVIIAGPQGSGKGTQSVRLATHLGVTHVDFGAEFRRLLKEDPAAVLPYTQEKYDRGEMAPDEVVCAMAERIIPQYGFLVDGFPRSRAQAEWMRKNRGAFHVVILELTEEKSVERLLKRGRSDDTPEGIKRRLSVYKEKVMKPLLEFFTDKISIVDGDESEEEVFNRILSAIE